MLGLSKTFIDAEASEKSIKAGLWADKDPMPPWEWRRAQRKNLYKTAMIPNQRIPINPISSAKPFAYFVQAQNMVYDEVILELEQGRKETHWMWYIFPQLKGLGTSLKAQKYGIDNLQQAADYLQHPVLGQGLLQCTRLVLTHRDKHPSQIFSEVDTLKFRSCMTLFKNVPNSDYCFRDALMLFFSNEEDPSTRRLVGLNN